MNNKNWKDIVELVGIAAIVASLVFVGLQMRQAQDIALSELSASIHASRVASDGMIAAHPDIWVRGNAGDELTEAEQATYRAILNSHYWRHFIGWQQRQTFGRKQQMDFITAEFSVFLHDNPGARRNWIHMMDDGREKKVILNEDYNAGVDEFQSAIIEGLSKLDEMDN